MVRTRRWNYTTAEDFQLPVSLPYSVVGWRQEEHPAIKTCLKFPLIDNCLMVTK